ncbi:MAG: hypothetical protein GDA66_03755 [Nitrospira sp. CR1.2]|nr:hypothetical protein [Nitrospira sp. CR1.2]
MRKNPASGVLARHGRLTGSAAFTSVPHVIPRGVNLSDSPYRKSTIPPFACCGLAGRPFLRILQCVLTQEGMWSSPRAMR